MKKEDIRRSIKAIKSQLNKSDAIKAAEIIFRQLENTAAFKNADKILLYHSLPDEVSTHTFLNKWHSKKQIYLPRVNGDTLDILPYDSNNMHTGAFNIEEPSGNEITDINEIELIVVPAVAYDCNGNRVGRGKGYYDRLMSNSKAIKIGVVYDFQLISDNIDAKPHDVKVNMIITEKRLVKVN